MNSICRRRVAGFPSFENLLYSVLRNVTSNSRQSHDNIHVQTPRKRNEKTLRGKIKAATIVVTVVVVVVVMVVGLCDGWYVAKRGEKGKKI